MLSAGTISQVRVNWADLSVCVWRDRFFSTEVTISLASICEICSVWNQHFKIVTTNGRFLKGASSEDYTGTVLMPVDSHLFKSVQTVFIIRLEGQQGGKWRWLRIQFQLLSPSFIRGETTHARLRIETSVWLGSLVSWIQEAPVKDRRKRSFSSFFNQPWNKCFWNVGTFSWDSKSFTLKTTTSSCEDIIKQ